MSRRVAALVAALSLLLAACGGDEPSTAPLTAPPLRELLAGPEVAALVPQVVATLPHDPDAFTQGLEEHGGALLESTGLYGASDRRRVDPATGEVLDRVELPAEHFGEGLTVVGDRVIQLTWQEGTAHVADAGTLAPLDTISYQGEGWGLCHDGTRLVMSDGSSTLRFRHPATFDEIGSVDVALGGQPVTRLNELECADGVVWANVWGATDIVAVDPASGEVRAVLDASSLVPDSVEGQPDAVLNGIARRPGTDRFWLTGKLWPVLYEVEVAPA